MKVIALLAVLFGFSIGVVGKAEPNEALRPTLIPLVTISGTDSHVRKPSFKRVTSQEEWMSTWATHLGTTREDAYRPNMEIDFGRCLVVVIFRGERDQTRGIHFEPLMESADSIVIRFHELGYGISLVANVSPPPPERPYAFIVLPTTDKRIVLEENIRPNKEGLPPVWKECARLEEGQPFRQPNSNRQ